MSNALPNGHVGPCYLRNDAGNTTALETNVWESDCSMTLSGAVCVHDWPLILRPPYVPMRGVLGHVLPGVPIFAAKKRVVESSHEYPV